LGTRKSRSIDDEGSTGDELKKQYSYEFESGWYLPGNPDARSERRQQDIDESNELLPREDFFALVGIALGQIEIEPNDGARHTEPKHKGKS
jgi:hypothetical protein